MKFSKKVLENGLRVVTIPMKDNPTVTVLVLVEAGSKYETKRINGISHFLEHMCFKGTLKRPKPIDIAKEFDALGSESNAFTSQEYTGYFAKSDAKHFKQILDIVSDVYLNSTFPEAEIEKEKGVVIDEINMYADMLPRHVQDMIGELLYGDQPAGWKITGEKKNITEMSRKDFVQYKKEHYVPNATTIVVAGHVAEKEVLKEIKKIFDGIKNTKKSSKVKVKENQSKPNVLLKFKKTDQAHFVLAVRTFDMFHKWNPTLEVLAGVLGSGMSSRLFQRIREELGVGYYVRAYSDSSTDHGFLQISAGVDEKRIHEVLEAVLEECRKLKTYEIGVEELNKTKEYLIGNMKLSLESSDDIALFYGGQELLKKKITSPDEKATQIRKVSASDIKKLANEIFKDEKLNLALIGPYKNSKDFEKILKF